MSKALTKISPLLNFLREAKAELKRVTWPGRRQVWYSTLVVIFFTVCVAFYLGAVDFLLTWIFSSILG